MFSDVISINSIKPKIKELKLSVYLLNKNVLTRSALILLILLVFLAILAPLIIPYPDHIFTGNDPANSLRAPSLENWFGTEIGRASCRERV